MGIIKWVIKRLLFLVVVLIVVVLAFQKQLVKIGIRYAFREATNADLKIGAVESRIHRGYLKLKDITLLNPEGFKESRLAEINFLLSEIDLFQLLKGKIEFKKLFIDINKIYILREERGTNLVEVRKPSKARRRKYRSKKRRKIFIQDLRIKISQVIYKDYRSQPPKMGKIYLDLERKYTNVTEIKKIIDSILVEGILKATFSNLAPDINQQGFKESILDRILNIFK